ncbi:MAG: ECF transporter S component, partial [Anaerolineae bacterium]
MTQRRTYFTTRDLLMMAALAALGGVVSTYVNAVGDVFQSIFGFAGTTQWAAGLHVLWLTLAVGLTRKQGAGTITGLLKGGVELLTGNTHGLLVVLVDVVAGLLVDLGFLPFRKKDSLAAYCLAGGLASASNVFVFQLFASVPSDTLAYWALLLVAGVAALSGVLFAGLLSHGLLNALRRAGVVKDAAPAPMGSAYPVFLLVAALLTVVLTV